MSSNIENRVTTLEQIAQTLTQLLVRADARMDQHDSWIQELGAASANADARIAALADAQIRTEEALKRLSEAQARLIEAQAHTDQKLDALIDIVREMRAQR